MTSRPTHQRYRRSNETPPREMIFRRPPRCLPSVFSSSPFGLPLSSSRAKLKLARLETAASLHSPAPNPTLRYGLITSWSRSLSLCVCSARRPSASAAAKGGWIAGRWMMSGSHELAEPDGPTKPRVTACIHRNKHQGFVRARTESRNLLPVVESEQNRTLADRSPFLGPRKD